MTHIPPDYKTLYNKHWHWPLEDTLRFEADAAWGGTPGFFEDAEGMSHVDRDCTWFFAAHYGGRYYTFMKGCC